MSPTRRRKARAGIVLAVAVAALAAAAAFVVAPRLGDDAPSAASGSTAAPTRSAGTGDGAPVEGVAGTPSAPYTLKPEPDEVATDAPVERDTGEVDVVLTYVTVDEATGTVQASGYAAGVLEDGGTCTLTLSGDGEEVTATSKAAADATTTTCGLLETPARVAAGTWDAVLTYSSARAEGTSRATEVTIR